MAHASQLAADRPLRFARAPSASFAPPCSLHLIASSTLAECLLWSATHTGRPRLSVFTSPVKRSEALLILKRRNVNGAQTAPPRPSLPISPHAPYAWPNGKLSCWWTWCRPRCEKLIFHQSRYPRSRCDRADDQDHLIDPVPSSRSWSQVGTVSTIIELPGRLSAPYDGGR
jgi:hypothetical protein